MEQSNMTTIAAALEKAGYGYSRAQMEIYPAIEQFVSAGGTELALLTVYREAIRRGGQGCGVQSVQGYSAATTNPIPRDGQLPYVREDQVVVAEPGNPMPDEGPRDNVHQDPKAFADVRQPIPDSGHFRRVQQDQKTDAAAGNPNTRGSGHSASAHQGRRSLAAPARGPSQAYIEAAGKSRLQTARTLLDVRKTSDGRYWGDVCPYEFVGMERDGSIARRARDLLGTLNDKEERTTLRNLLAARSSPEKIASLFEERAA